MVEGDPRSPTTSSPISPPAILRYGPLPPLASLQTPDFVLPMGRQPLLLWRIAPDTLLFIGKSKWIYLLFTLMRSLQVQKITAR